MRGVVAAGNVHTAAAAARILGQGGNAVDAAVAAALACFSAEPLLTSAGGAGVMLVREPGALAPIAVDFFSPFPGASGRPERIDFHPIEIDFGAAKQVFHIGRGAAAVPLALDGLASAAARFGSLPLTELAAPGIELARDGVVLDAITAKTFALLWPILRHDPACWAELAEGLSRDRPPAVGERVRNRRLAATLAEFARLGATPPAVREGLLAEFGPARGGLLSAADLDAARVEIGPAHGFELDGWTVATSPRVGGRLVAMIAEDLVATAAAGTAPEEVLRRARASRAGHRARTGLPDPRGSTTHVSVVDERGGAASVTLTAGEGCGHVITGTGVHVNNFLGEEDLNPVGFHVHRPGAALPTMIAPTIAVHRDGRVVALGSGGANRIRSAVSQVLYALVGGSALADAVAGPRVHGEDSGVWVELDGPWADEAEAIAAALAAEFPAVHAFSARDFFFGGVHVAARAADGSLAGIGDARRAGAVVQV